ncbi:MAG: hypothetical protein M1294_16205 [Firmicutes bacterium]|nr:hypothetical protein [Bacillota bacterium]
MDRGAWGKTSKISVPVTGLLNWSNGAAVTWYDVSGFIPLTESSWDESVMGISRVPDEEPRDVISGPLNTGTGTGRSTRRQLCPG